MTYGETIFDALEAKVREAKRPEDRKKLDKTISTLQNIFMSKPATIKHNELRTIEKLRNLK